MNREKCFNHPQSLAEPKRERESEREGIRYLWTIEKISTFCLENGAIS